MQYPKSKAEIIYAALDDEILTFVYGSGINNEKDIKQVCHLPFKSSKEYTILDQEKNFLKGDLEKLHHSETGKHIFVASDNVACVFKVGNPEPLLIYEKQEGDRRLSNTRRDNSIDPGTEPFFVGDEEVWFATGKYAIGWDLSR